MTDIEEISSGAINSPLRSADAGLCAEHSSCAGRCTCDFFQNNQQRVRLHEFVSTLKWKRDGVAVLSEDDSSSNRLSQSAPAAISEIRKSSRKGSPSQLSEEEKSFFNFLMVKKRRGIGKQHTKPDNVDHRDGSVESSVDEQVASQQTDSQVLPYLPYLDSSPAMQDIPLGTSGVPHIIPFGDGSQQALVFFVNALPVPTSEGHPGVNKSNMGNTVFVTQPVALNLPVMQPETVDREGALNPCGGVIETAMQLANVAPNMSEGDTVQPLPGCSTQNPLLTLAAAHVLPHISQNVVVGPSSSTEGLSVEDVVQSVTIQTTQVPQTAAAGLFPTITAEVNSAGAVGGSAKVMHSKKATKFREIPTQTGDKDGVVSVADSIAQEAAQTAQTTMTQKDKEGKPTKKQATERVRCHSCEVCNKMFYTNHDLKRHKTTHGDARPFMCEICKKTFRTQSELNLHTPIHNEDTPYKCEYCGKEFRTKGCIKSHIKYHIGDKRHKCKECDRAFVKSADLKRHVAGHRNEKSYKCGECESAFTRRDNLKAHMLLHSRNGVVTCNLCNKEFINSVYLKRHMHIHKQAKKKPYECQWCPKTYEQLEGLRRHIRQHVGDEKFVCKHCAKKFITSIQLKRHLWLSHDKESPYRRSVL